MRSIASLACCLVIGSTAAAAQTPAAAPNDYGDARTWLCRPGRTDACASDFTTTVVAADGTVARETWSANAAAPIDCFYVYPTVSTDLTPTSDMTADLAETNVIRQQFARFASVCRPYAPLYRQVTLAGLRQMIAGGGGGAALASGIQYNDVRDAWRHYLQHDNNGRGVVLVGHSQGAFILAELIRSEIEGTPAQSRIVSAILLGATLSVPKGRDVGGTFKQIPVCRSAAQTGCLIGYVSFRSSSPPPANTRFGRVTDPAVTAVCTNPAALAGGSGALNGYVSTAGATITALTGAATPPKWIVPERPIDTPWVSLPGLLTARCASNEHATYLEVTVHGNPADPRADDIPGDLVAGGVTLTDWGLHLVDVNIALGNLIAVVGEQAKAWLAKRP